MTTPYTDTRRELLAVAERDYKTILESAATTYYPLASQGVFRTIQGEGSMLGTPMVFVRLAGCPVGCPQCDTDYTVAARATATEISRQVAAYAGLAQWAWVTGGEPTTHDIPVLVTAIRRAGLKVALATAGLRPVLRGWNRTVQPGGVEFLSVSPHTTGPEWVQRRGDQLNVVPGLNGLKLSEFEGLDLTGFSHKYVTPMYPHTPRTIAECVEWVNDHPDWKLGTQAHKGWGLA